MKKVMLSVLLSFGLMATAQENYGEIVGKVYEPGGEFPAIGARVWVNTGTAVLGAVADVNGRYRISTVPAGTYTINFSYLGDSTSISNQTVNPDGYANIDDVTFGDKMMNTIVIEHDRIKIEAGNEHMITLGPKDLKHNVNIQSPVDLISNMSSDIKKSDDGELYFRGARKGEMTYLLDGVKTRDISKVPGVAIGGVSVYTGGIPAKYGDTTGGVVVMETKSYFDLWRQWKIANSN
jgi:hypothetical protein